MKLQHIRHLRNIYVVPRTALERHKDKFVDCQWWSPTAEDDEVVLATHFHSPDVQKAFETDPEVAPGVLPNILDSDEKVKPHHIEKLKRKGIDAKNTDNTFKVRKWMRENCQIDF
jgi:hypothetical protein